MKSKNLTLTVVLVFFCELLNAQDRSNRGKEFWLGYGFNRHFLMPNDNNVLNSQNLALYISTEQAAVVTVSVNNTGWSQTLTIPANTADATIIVPKSGAGDARILTDGLSSKAIHIVSDVPVAVYAHQYDAMFSAATMLMPVESYGYSYYSINWAQTRGDSKLPAQAAGSWNYRYWLCYFYVVASEDNTRLQITPTDTTQNGWLPGQTYTVNLNKGEIYNLFGKDNYVDDYSNIINSSKDLTGSKIISVPGNDGNCHPFALFSGSGGVRMCYADGGEAMMQQVFPSQAWGTRYLTYHTINNENTDFTETHRNYYRICVQDPTAIVKRNGVPLSGLIRNFYYEIMDSTGGDFIESDKPICIAQFTPNRNQCWRPPTGIPPQPPFPYGDPEMFYLSPIEQGQKNVRFYTSSKSGIDFVYTNIHLPTTAVGSLRIDGNAPIAGNVIPHPNKPGFSVAFARFFNTESQHTITSDSIFNASVYGLGFFESYGYNVGTKINNLNNYSAIQNTLNTNGQIDTFTCPKTPVRLIAKLAYQATSIHWKLSQVNGLLPSADSIIINPVPIGIEIINGRTYYLYTLQQDFEFATPGKYSIPISYSATVIENCNQTEYATLSVLVKAGPAADFSISAQQCLSDTVRFTGTTPNQNGLFNYTNYLWNFDDATSQNTINSKKRFASSGNQDVRYRVYANNGCIGDTTKTISITNGTGPQIGFTINGKYCADSTLSFSSAIPASTNTSYWWDFGDGQIQTTNNNTIVHQYTAATNRIVRHTATITNGCNPDTAQQTITAINNNPSAVPFTATGDTLCINKPIQINATANGVTKWNWNFGAGTGAQVPPFIYNYSNAGSYTINLTITDGNGCGSPISTQPINIAPNPVVSAGPDKFVPFNSSTTLDATLINAANYNINWQPVTYLNNSNILTPISTPGQSPITYTIQVTDKISLCTGWDKVIITPISKLYIPTAFTPNNNGKNEKWEIIGMALYPDGIVTIYNRWGEKIFESKNYYQNAWNGTYKGQLQPIGSYIYVIQLNDATKQVLKGTVTIIQ